jgi:hypothetical protein
MVIARMDWTTEADKARVRVAASLVPSMMSSAPARKRRHPEMPATFDHTFSVAAYTTEFRIEDETSEILLRIGQLAVSREADQ